MSDLMSVRLHLSGVRVRGVLVDTVDRLKVEVASTREWSVLSSHQASNKWDHVLVTPPQTDPSYPSKGGLRLAESLHRKGRPLPRSEG